ncbi:DUF4345 domain-containing protein [Sphingosinicella sp. YJ22]|uniref:DUF4345 domain-containing protein n=1 Tax=Sphingosinicella sp. YJ22 TaxID=1104780 RepID=UPI00140DC2A4|nr:DUF4345 domain-containing protein [Sphingosinicella sp. YJ22]
MRFASERRLLQGAILAACLVPLSAGLAGVVEGPAMLRGVMPEPPADLDSHMRYLSGLLLGIGIGFVACVPRIEARGAMFRLLGLIVVAGGLARGVSLADSGAPGWEHRLALAMELGVTPLLVLWQARIARLAAAQ